MSKTQLNLFQGGEDLPLFKQARAESQPAKWTRRELPPHIDYLGPHDLMISTSKVKGHQGPWKYTIYIRGGAVSQRSGQRYALRIGGADTLKEAKRLALELIEVNRCHS